ncbi:recombinase family protein [Streptomyces sp. NPDC007983]|uniref:recombinase family protein n=1 Tax=Streptomyces sp. NPDC007983 TaxID=3364800 RepID=UPI0036EC5A5A
MRALELPPELFADVSEKLVAAWRARAAKEHSSDLRAAGGPVRYTLLSTLCHVRETEITDSLVELVIQLVQKINTRAEKKVEGEFNKELKRVRGKEGILLRLAEAAVAEPGGTVRKVSYPVAGESTLKALAAEAAANEARYRARVRTVLRSSYSNHWRRMLSPLLNALDLKCNNTAYRPVMDAIDLLKRYLDQPIAKEGAFFDEAEKIPLAGVVREEWRKAVVDERGRVERIPYELCVLVALRDHLRRREIWVPDPQQPSPTDRSDADDVEQHACPKCGAQPGSPCRSRGGAVASAYHTRRFTLVPRLKKVLRVPTPADRGPGRPWRPGTPPLAPIDPGLPSADIRIGYARCSTLGQELDSQLDALSKHGIPRDKIFSEKISTRIRVRPKCEEALRTAREVKAHAPHCRVIFTVYEMKRLGRDAAELTALADHLTAHGLVLEMLAGPLPGIYDPTGPGKLLFAFFAAMAETERENIRESTLEGLDTAARKGKHGGRPPVITDDMLHTVLRRRAGGESVEQIQPDLIIPTGKRKGQNPSVASIYRALAEHAKREAYPEAVERAHADFATLTGPEVPEPRTGTKALTTP